jgi:hypothetical protein
VLAAAILAVRADMPPVSAGLTCPLLIPGSAGSSCGKWPCTRLSAPAEGARAVGSMSSLHHMHPRPGSRNLVTRSSFLPDGVAVVPSVLRKGRLRLGHPGPASEIVVWPLLRPPDDRSDDDAGQATY